MALVDPGALLLLMAANATPVIMAGILGPRLAAPIDAVFRRDGHRPIFGAHKTWRGLVGGVAASMLAGALLPCGIRLGAEFGVLALAGDLCSSFVKRRLDRPSGTGMLLLDQLPESLLPLLLLARPLGLTATSIVGTTACFTILDVLTERWRKSVARRSPPARAHRPGPPPPPLP